MANIQIDQIRPDIKDRLSNMVEAQQITEAMRTKMSLEKRIGYAIDTAYSRFVIKANPGLLSGLTALVDPAIDTTIGVEGIVDNLLKVYNWPSESYEARDDGGVLNFIINDKEFTIEHSMPYLSLRDAAGSVYYGTDADFFYVDFKNKRIHTPMDSTIQTRIIKKPQSVVNDNITELLIDEAYQPELASMTMEALVQISFDTTGKDMQQEQQNDNE